MFVLQYGKFHAWNALALQKYTPDQRWQSWSTHITKVLILVHGSTFFREYEGASLCLETVENKQDG